MSLFPRFASSEFAPIFRLLDDYDTHRSSRPSAVRSFQPKFDVREIKNAYELHGELPGIDQSDVSIEFSDPHTLVIKGRTERESTSGTPPAGRITGDVTDQSASSYQKATVEDEGAATSEASTPAVATPATSTTEVSKPASAQDAAKYWVSERSVGEFHRSFSFPSRVDQDTVKASLKNGILSVVVPKAAAHQSRRINID
ncbi:MAG: hypothetical protein M1833_001004 [Piccolia ochrophora]|nr:MAG: hypothetical protein M1833_001004 [Piccolia ochrophora]